MSIIFILGFIAAAFIGISLGLIGSGGSILTMPVLVYMMGIDPIVATAYSLFIVGSIALVGGIRSLLLKQVNIKAVFLFGIPAVISVFVTRKFLVPLIPEVIFSNELITITRGLMVMVLFAFLMVTAAYFMIKKPKEKAIEKTKKTGTRRYYVILLEGLIVGAVTGLLGAGGGFLIIPALVLLSGLSMREAVGTSLLIIAIKSLIGFTGDIGQTPIDWWFLIGVSILPVLGIFLGTWLRGKIAGDRLRPLFGWFVLIMGIFIILKEII
jgi:uncharacterized membrane protein YfcA